MNGFNNLSDRELATFLDDISDSLASNDPQDFEKIIKYLMYTINYKIHHNQLTHLTQIYDTINRLISHKKFLINLELDQEFLKSIHSKYIESNGLIEYLVINSLYQLASSELIIKRFVISIINIAVSSFDLHFRNRIVTQLQSSLHGLVNECLTDTYSNDKLIVCINLMCILHDNEISQKLTMDQFEFQTVFKRGWYLVSSGENDNLKSMMIINWTDAIILDRTTNFSNINLVIDWIISCLDTSSPVLVHSISKSLLKLLKFSIKLEIVDNLINLLNIDYYLSQSLHSTMIQTLKVYQIVKTQKKPRFPTYLNSELNIMVVEIQDLINQYDDSLNFLHYKSHSNDDWLDHAIKACKSGDSDLTHTVLSAARHFPCNTKTDCDQCNPVIKNQYSLVSLTRPYIESEPKIKRYYKEIILYLENHNVNSNPLINVNFLLAVYSLLTHYKTKDAQLLDYLLMKLSAPHRDIRLLSCRIIPLFLLTEKDTQLDQMFSKIFSHVSLIPFNSQLHLAEVTLKMLTELCIISNGDWLNVLILKLIDMLGEDNEHHVNLVYSSLLTISDIKGITPYKLLFPFLPIIAVRLLKTPKILDLVISLLGVNKNYFLNRTKEYTVPHILDYYKVDFLQEISVSCNKTRQKLIEDCLPRILATFLVKDDVIDEKYISTILKNAQYRKFSKFDDLFDNVGDIVWNILLQINHDDVNRKIKNQVNVFNALEYVSKKSISVNGNISRKEVRNFTQLDYIKYLIDEHILEIVQKISECINQITTPYYEKVLSVKSIEFLIKYDIEATSSVLGQISSCLQSLIEIREFEFIAINCVNLLVNNLNTSSLISLFDIIISVIFQKFQQLELRSQNMAIDIIKMLFKEIKKLDNNYVLYYFSIPYLPPLINYRLDSNFKNVKISSRVSYFPEFTRRLKTLNPYVVKQALTDLINFITAYQIPIQQEFAKDSLSTESINSISTLINSLLDTANRFKYTKQEEIPTNCSKALSIIGALDGNKFNLKTIKNHITLIHNFHDYTETSELLTDFLENILIISFWGSNDPVKQMYYSYAFQQFLKVLKLTPSVLSSTTSDIYVEVWNNFSDISKSTLLPFFQSKFFAKSSNYVRITYPIYKESKSFDNWIFELTGDLIRRPVNSNLKVLFDAFGALIKYRDNEICIYLLKYLVLYHILNDQSGDTTFTDILLEFKTVLATDLNTLASADSIESVKLCYQTIFEILDYFNQWHSLSTEYLIYRADSLTKQNKNTIRKNLKIIEQFLGQIPLELIASKSSQCNDYERTIFYVEQYFRDHGTLEISSLHDIYANINDLDALDGVLKRFPVSNTDPLTQLKSLQFDSNWSIAQEAFQVLSDFDDDKNQYKTKLLQFLNEHASYDQVLNSLATEMSSNNTSKIPLDWALQGLQASMLSGFCELDKWLFITKSIGEPQDVFSTINLNLAEGIRNELINDNGELGNVFDTLYKIIGSSLTSSSSLSTRNTKLMLELHSIYDLSKLFEAYKNGDSYSNILKYRIDNIDQSFESRWKLLSMHNVFNIQFKCTQETSETFLHCSRLARQNQKYDISVSSILKSLALGSKNAEFEYAQLLWAQKQQTDAIKKLELILDVDMEPRTKAKMQLTYSEWLDESNHSSSTTIVEEYTKSCHMANDWDKPYYSLGKYYDKLRASKEFNDGTYEELTIRLYLKSLSLGSSYIYEILPKLITIWLDFASDFTRESNSKLNSILRLIDSESKVIPAYVWYTCFTQILSRITHKHELSYKLLSKIILKVLTLYPKHGLWFILSHLSSKDRLRRARIEDILTKFSTISNSSGIKTDLLLSSAQDLFTNLIQIAQFPLKKGTRKASLIKDLNMLKLIDPYDSLVIPVRSNLEIKIPSHIHLKRETQAFPRSSLITFNGADDRVNVFHSLQMPKQITIRGSDGKPYRLMIKKDDTRKDAKVVEFTTMVNRLLTLSNESRKRNLSIPNYSVVPLAENMGVIEFVSDVTTMKSIVNDERRRSGRGIEDSKIFSKLSGAQKICKTKLDNGIVSAKRDLMKLFEGILDENPPVLYKWFINQFSDPMSWYLARNSYIRTAAVMSIVGFIIGLGDRHCENILFFKKSGMVLHIDFDCLFEKGAHLPTPEIVPFRLTPNMVDAMGINQVEGTFRRSCEVSFTILRENEMSLMNILETLLYDPLLDWKDQIDPQAHLKRVRRKIRGLLEENEGVAMNIHGQVDILIHQASCIDNLCQMYGGWAPHI